MNNADLIIASLERAAELCDDLTPLVYDRLFADHPGMRDLFVRDTDGSVRGEMLARVIEAILDFVDQRLYAAHLIQCEVVTHEGYGAPPEVFRLFFGYVAHAIGDLIGPEWTVETEAAWRTLLADLDFYVTHPDQAATLALA
jgi:hemoglobin-like flavoprotein